MFDTRLDQEVAYSIIETSNKLPNLKDLKIRDLFAMFALAGLEANPSIVKCDFAKSAYKVADEMLEERRRKNEEQSD